MQPPDALPRGWQRLLALSGAAFALLFVVGWFTNGGLTPHYNEPNQEWINWARDNRWNSRISAFLMLLAGFFFLALLLVLRLFVGVGSIHVQTDDLGAVERVQPGGEAVVDLVLDVDRLVEVVGGDQAEDRAEVLREVVLRSPAYAGLHARRPQPAGVIELASGTVKDKGISIGQRADFAYEEKTR